LQAEVTYLIHRQGYLLAGVTDLLRGTGTYSDPCRMISLNPNYSEGSPLRHSVVATLSRLNGKRLAFFLVNNRYGSVFILFVVVIRSFVFIEGERCIRARVHVQGDRVGFLFHRILQLRAYRKNRACLYIKRNASVRCSGVDVLSALQIFTGVEIIPA